MTALATPFSTSVTAAAGRPPRSIRIAARRKSERSMDLLEKTRIEDRGWISAPAGISSILHPRRHLGADWLRSAPTPGQRVLPPPRIDRAHLGFVPSSIFNPSIIALPPRPFCQRNPRFASGIAG